MSKPALSLTFAVLMCATMPAQSNFKVIHSFSGYPNDGMSPVSDVVFDKAGNVYGTTAGGGSGYGCGDAGCGSVYELSPNKDGSWSEAVIYNFCTNFDGQDCLDGSYPYGGLVLDAAGNLYGTTTFGGPDCPPQGSMGCGVLFELSPPLQQGGLWTETVLHNFCSQFIAQKCMDGLAPVAQLTFDRLGNLFGTTNEGGNGHATPPAGGTAFELSPAGSGWIEAVLYSFCSKGSGDTCPDGAGVLSGLTLDSSGNLYGTTTYSGNVSQSPRGGTIYQISPSGKNWKHVTLLDIPEGSMQSILQASVAVDTQGNLYSTYSEPFGGVFEMDRAARKLDLFPFNGQDGFDPIGGVYIDSAAGALYGTTSGGNSGPGNVFAISKNGKETVLHEFCSFADCADGEVPLATLVPGKDGKLYGTTQFGGDYGAGVVFEITP